MPKNVLIDLKDYSFNFTCGGVTVQFELCRILCELGVNARIKANNHTPNSICNNYYNNEFSVDDNCVVIYCETIEGNPCNAKHVVRWILAPLGVVSPLEITNTWGKNDLVYYFNSESKFYESPERIGVEYKLLNALYINPYVKQLNYEERKGVCYTIRKAHKIHKGGFNFIHFDNSFEITYGHSQEDCINLFNTFEYFVSYDSLTFYIIIAALCGCIPIVYPVSGLTKQQWIQTTAAAEYCTSKGLDNLYGIAYGVDDILHAFSTLHLVKEQWDDILKFNKETIIAPFINDIQDFKAVNNTLEKNFYNGPSKFNCVINNRYNYKFENESLSFKNITNYEDLL